jgi:hypothetical protein
MDVSKFKDITQKLSFMRDYSSLVIPIVILFVAAILFVPTQLMSAKLKEQMGKESIQSGGNKVKQLSKAVVPVKQWEKERDYQQVYVEDANQIALLARRTSERELLSYKIFPEPNEKSPLIFKEFGKQFRSKIEQMLERINARDCPTDAELQDDIKSSYRSDAEMSTAGSSERDNLIKDELCRERAKSIRVYVNPADLSGYEFWDEYEYVGTNQAVEDCWYWQLGYWITEDIINTVGVMDSGSSSVLTSPVKRVMSVSFSRGDVKSGNVKTDDIILPHYVITREDGLVESYTARICNSDIDVVHFTVSVLVSAKAVIPFMQQLCTAKEHKFMGFSGKDAPAVFKHNQITILDSKMSPIIRESKEHQLYRYGNDAVVKLDLVCEYVFNKSGYDAIKPVSTKESTKSEMGNDVK